MITGEKIQTLCDYYIGTNEDFNFNPIIKNQTSKHINLDNYNIEIIKNLRVKNIFCYTHLIDGKIENFNNNLKNISIILSNISTKFNIIFHNSDGAFKNEHKSILQISNVNKIFTQNLSIEPEERIIPLPIGIANSMWAHGNLNIWNNILNSIDLSKKTELIYFNFNINTYNKGDYTQLLCIQKRKKCYDVISKMNIPNIENKNYMDYLKILSIYKFAICPEGNGLDTHRFWECLYLKVIPICLKNNITEYYSKFFPIFLLDKWEELNTENIDNYYNNSTWNNYNILHFEHFLQFFEINK
tara:strand:- start:4732 stop:5631 length:900 start_codon:yes stop_codon:yes gene_type:complete